MPKKNYNAFGPYKRNGKYFFKYEEPGSESATGNGKPRLLSGGTFSTKKICEGQMKAKDREINDPGYLAKQRNERKRAKAEDYGERWLRTQATRKGNTFQNYSNSVRKYFIPYFSGRWMHEITATDVQEFVNWTLGFRKVSTVRTIMIGVKVMFHQAERDGAVDESPVGMLKDLSLPRSRKTVRPFEDSEVDRILEAIEEHFRPLVLLLVTTGIRCGEAFALTWDRIDLNAGTAYIDRQVQDGRFCPLKGEKGEQLRPFTAHLPPVTVEALRAYRSKSHTLTVEWEHGVQDPEEVELITVSKTGLVLYEQLFQDPWYRMLDALKWSRRGNSPHRLRHAFAVGLIDDGAPLGQVQARLNHSDPMTTQRMYGGWWKDSDDRLDESINERFARLAA